MLRQLRARWRYRRFADDTVEELCAHRAQLVDALERQGMSHVDAQARANRTIGNELRAREEVRAVWLAPRLESVGHDIRLSVRQLRRSPAFTVTALLIVSLSVAAVTAVYSLTDALLLQAPPYVEADRIVAMSQPGGGALDGVTYHAVRERTQTIAVMAAQGDNSGWNLAVGERAEYVSGQRVSHEFFRVLGVPPALGRAFSPAEDESNGPLTVILSEKVWGQLFDRDPAVIGRIVQLGGTPHEVVGVMPATFTPLWPADLWIPLRLSARDNSVNYTVIGRLAPAHDLAAARAELATIRATSPEGVTEQSAARIRAADWIPLRQRLGLERRTPLLVLLCSVIAVALVGSVNLAGLQLLRTLSRRHEIATRIAVGGGTRRIVQQLVIDALVLAALGGAAGVALAYVLLPSLSTQLPAELLMGRQPVVNGTVLLASLAVTLTAGAVFGLSPALTALRLDLRATLAAAASRHAGAGGRAWVRRTLLAGEVAVTVALLVVAGLLVRTLVRMQSSELGFEPAGVTVAQVSLQGRTYDEPAALARLVEQSLTALAPTPGITSAAVANHVPVERGLNQAVLPPDRSLVGTIRSIDWRYVSPSYFSLLAIDVQRGRTFDERDGSGAPPVAVVNQAFARAYFGDAPAIGRTIVMDPSVGDVERPIIGVVGDVRSRSGAGWSRSLNALGGDASPTIYVPVAQVPQGALRSANRFFPANWIVRTPHPVPQLEREIERIIRVADPSLAVIRVLPMTDVVAEDLRISRLLAWLLAGFAGIALVVACTGIYGLVAYAASRRTCELAVRVALGASRRSLLRTLLHETVVVTSLGAFAGLALAFVTARGVTVYLAGTAPLDPVTLTIVVAILAACVGVAGLAPALRAIRADPLSALRVE